MGEADILAFVYGTVEVVDEDVALFERFYGTHFREQALLRMVDRRRRGLALAAAALVLVAAGCVVPVVVNPSSLFAFIILAFGVLALGAAVWCGVRLFTARAYCEERFPRLMDAEFAASRSATKRVFGVALDDEGIEVTFGVSTGVRQRRRKRYDEIAHVYVDDELVFVEGLTWFSRFQLEEALYRELCARLETHCTGRYVRLAPFDEVGAAGWSRRSGRCPTRQTE